MPLKKLMAGLLLCLCVNILHAENPIYEGVVKDYSNNPLEFVNVTLLTLNDSTLIDGAVTDMTGKFSLVGNGTPVFLRITAMGFEDRTIDNPKAAAGDIILAPASYMLGEVTVKGSRPMAKLKGDGIQVAISDTYLANTGTALDVLGKMPFVTKSGSEVEVLGKGTPLIYINGRQVRDMSELNQLASSQIKSVDVVTNPGARYASTVNSVIRITTMAPVGEGFSVNDRTTIGYKHYAYLFEQVNLNWRKNGLDLFGMLNYENYRERPGFFNETMQYLKSGIVRQNSVGHDFAKYPVYQGKIGLNYKSISHNFGLYYDFSFKPSTITGGSLADRFIDNAFSETLENHADVTRHNRQHLVSAYYSGEIGKWHLSANFDALWQINDRHSDEVENSSANRQRDFSTVNDVPNRLLAGNIVASVPLWKGEFRFGTEVSNVHRTDLYVGNRDYITDNDIKIDETNSALFAETDQTFGAITASAGLRWEYTDSRYWQSGKLNDDMSRRYHNLAPSASLSFPIGDVKGRLSYMRKTTRPAFEQLSSAVKYLDRYSYESGNPNLRPVYFSARTSGNGDNLYLKSYWQCNLGLYKSFADDTWSVKLQLNDVFDTWRQEFTSYDAISAINVNKLYDTRDLSITIRYNFNSIRSRYKGNGAGNSDKNRF